MYEILSYHKIKTPKTEMFNSPPTENMKYKFPLIGKPNAQGTSAGITPNSVVFTYNGLKKQAKFINRIFKRAALVQPFMDGKEFSISLLGNTSKVLPIIGINYDKLPENRLHFMPDGWNTMEYGDNFAICPAKINKTLKERIKNIVLSCWQALDIKDYCRIYLRLDRHENIYVLDINSPTVLVLYEIEEDFFSLSAKRS